VLDEEVDLADGVPDVGGGATSDGHLGDDAEPAFDLVEPGGIGGCVVDVVSGPPCEPGPDLGMLVGGVIVDDEVDVERFGDVGVDVAQEGQELLVAMTSFALGRVTRPVATSRAANRVVVPCRT